jgi:glucosyl-3-phosphoglycerate synthase
VEGARGPSERSDWLRHRCQRSAEADLEWAVTHKKSASVALVLPARNEAATVGPLVAALRRELVEATGLVDELVVVDDGSVDATAELAGASGARVVSAEAPGRWGKGGAMRTGLAVTSSELVVFLDADVRDLPTHWVASLLRPLLADPAVSLVKAAYDRPLVQGGVAHPASGGRVTRLVARPVLGMIAPDLTLLVQPLAGETAARRALLERLPFAIGYGVELGLLLDAYAQVGLDGIAQVDLGVRVDRHHSDQALESMAAAVLAAAARRAGWPLPEAHAHARLVRIPEGYREERTPLMLEDLPPLVAMGHA